MLLVNTQRWFEYSCHWKHSRFTYRRCSSRWNFCAPGITVNRGVAWTRWPIRAVHLALGWQEDQLEARRLRFLCFFRSETVRAVESTGKESWKWRTDRRNSYLDTVIERVCTYYLTFPLLYTFPFSTEFFSADIQNPWSESICANITTLIFRDKVFWN